MFFDKDGKLIEALANPGKNAENSGTAIGFLAGKGATVVVAEGFGPKIVEVMKGKGIKAVSFKGSAEEAVKKVLASTTELDCKYLLTQGPRRRTGIEP